MAELWSKEKEKEFFRESRSFATTEQLFYLGDDGRNYAYWPKSYRGQKSTLQSRNSLIGNFTEKYSVDLLQNFARSNNLYAVQGARCDSIGLSNRSPADVVLSRSRSINQEASDIKAIIEVKMSLVWNWELVNNRLICLGDYKSHHGNPGLLRSDSMLKAIGKSINIRVSGFQASKIPIIILGNTPITDSYYSKVDHLKKAGIIQGFWSVNSKPLDSDENSIKKTDHNGFIRMDSISEIESTFSQLLTNKLEFFSSMKSKTDLGRIIELANRENNYQLKAERFLSLIRE